MEDLLNCQSQGDLKGSPWPRCLCPFLLLYLLIQCLCFYVFVPHQIQEVQVKMLGKHGVLYKCKGLFAAYLHTTLFFERINSYDKATVKWTVVGLIVFLSLQQQLFLTSTVFWSKMCSWGRIFFICQTYISKDYFI